MFIGSKRIPVLRFQRIYMGILINRFWVKSIINLSIQEKKRRSPTPTASIFGMNTSVISLIWVAAWNIATKTPATRPKSKQGAAKRIAVFTASIKNPVTKSGDIKAFQHACFGFSRLSSGTLRSKKPREPFLRPRSRKTLHERPYD